MSVSNKKTDTKTLKDETWATLKEIAESQKKADGRMEKFREDLKKSSEEFDRRIEKSREEFNLLMEKSSKEFRKDLKKLNETIGSQSEEFNLLMEKSSKKFREDLEEIKGTLGSWSKNIGDFAEDYFTNSFNQGKKSFFGKRFYKLWKNAPGIKSEYDIVLINGKYIYIIEVKFKGHINDIKNLLKKANAFREDYPYFQERKIHLGLASMSFYKELEQKCKDEGIAIVKQVGDKTIINYKHLKTF